MSGFEDFKGGVQYLSFLKYFKNIYYNENSEKLAKEDSVYIYSNIRFPDYHEDIDGQKEIFDSNTTYSVNNSNIYIGDISFYTNTQYIGTYNYVKNILYIIDIVNPYDNISSSIIDKIINSISGLKNRDISQIKEKLRENSKVKLMFGDRIYGLSIDFGKQSIIGKLLRKIPRDCFMHNNVLYKIVQYGVPLDFGLDAYKTELATKARDIVSEYRDQYYTELSKTKKYYEHIVSSSIKMPNVSPDDAINHKLMMGIHEDALYYIFTVTISVHTIINEKIEVYKKLSKPIVFKDGLLIIKVSQTNRVVGVQFRHEHRHFHTDDDGDVCLGSASDEISKKKVCSIQDVFDLKYKIVELMSVCNIASMYHRAWKADDVFLSMSLGGTEDLNKMAVYSNFE